MLLGNIVNKTAKSVNTFTQKSNFTLILKKTQATYKDRGKESSRKFRRILRATAAAIGIRVTIPGNVMITPSLLEK